MSTSIASGPFKTGTVREGSTANLGTVVLEQNGTIVQNSTSAVDLIFYLPANTKLLDFLNDVTVAFDSATSATLSAGITSGGTEYMSGVNVKAATGRIAATHTAAQLIAMNDIGTTNLTLYLTVTVVGATTAGNVFATVRYAQKNS